MSNKEIVQQLYADFGQGNIPGILNALSDDINWNVHGPAIIPYSGIKKGKDGALDFFKTLGATTTFEKFEAEAFIEEGDRVVALGVAHFTTISTGKQGINRWVMAWTFKDGKAISYENYIDTYVIAETFIK